ncbi:valine--tRNA ligase, chloroplastic/mitochondrial 2-like, partial [Salvia splendens]|uniref:valine--tRNA ligase, chloroplastic/mitochondrial 2-like n=1 Tax=Salvia splendens TaxID=180675 RepID=UPI001C273D26
AGIADNGVFTSPEVAKAFDFTAEERIYKWWESQGYFKPNLERGGDPFVVSMPPPNVTGSLHMGHAMFVTLEDIMSSAANRTSSLARVSSDVRKVAPVFSSVKQFFVSFEFLFLVDLYGRTITNQIKRLGASCDWTRERFTLDAQLSRAVVEAFVRLHEKGLIYQGSYMVNWSPKLQTAVSDLEVEYSEEPGALYHIKYRVAGGTRDDFLTIATTRPETLFGDTAIAVNPEDERYSKYIGKMAIVPMTYGRHVPIISDKYVDKDFGTGVLKISPGHDHNDYLLARKLGLPILNVMNKDGTLNEVAGLYCGLDRFEARKKLWSELEETGLAVKKEAYTMRVPRSQRGGEIIEPLVSKQWFVTMDSLAERALHAVEKGELTIVPERFEKISEQIIEIYNHWLSNIKDWCISRQLWWGHRIPVWYIVGKKCEDEYIVARNNEEALEKAREKYGKDVEIYQDPDVLDTWFSRHDILFFWVARMVMMGIEFTGTVPFSHVYLHGLIRDSQGRKMSKSLGNVIDPLDTIKDYGTDALRFTLSLGTAGQDLNLSTERLTSTKAFTNKLWNGGKFVLQNLPPQSDLSAWTAIQDYKFDEEESLLKLPLPECWVVTKLHMLIDAVTMSYDKFFLEMLPGKSMIFSGLILLIVIAYVLISCLYIEASKARLYQGDGSVASVAQAVLLYVFGSILKLLHPFMPFVTEELWQSLPNRKEALIVSAWPSTSLPRQTESVKKFENLQALTRAIRNARAEYSVEPAKRISASIVANAEVIQYISKEKDVLVLLSRLDLENVSFSQSPPGDASQSVHLVASEGLEAYLPLADMVDISAEMQRLSKRLAKMQTEYDGLMARLSSPSLHSRNQIISVYLQFVEKAPEDIVRGVREKAAEAEEKVTLTRNRLAFLQSTTLMPNQAQ